MKVGRGGEHETRCGEREGEGVRKEYREGNRDREFLHQAI